MWHRLVDRGDRHFTCVVTGREPSDICALLQRLQYGRSSAATVLSALQAIQTCTASAASAQARMLLVLLPRFCCLDAEAVDGMRAALAWIY